MTDYTELVKALRILQDKNSLSYYKRRVCKDAADAIEALRGEVEQKNKDIAVLQKCYQIADEAVDKALEPKRGEIVRCGECKHHLPETERTNPYCNRFYCMKPDDWFCADGERKVQE